MSKFVNPMSTSHFMWISPVSSYPPYRKTMFYLYYAFSCASIPPLFFQYCYCYTFITNFRARLSQTCVCLCVECVHFGFPPFVYVALFTFVYARKAHLVWPWLEWLPLQFDVALCCLCGVVIVFSAASFVYPCWLWDTVGVLPLYRVFCINLI